MPSFVWKYFSKASSENARCDEKGCKKIFKWNKGLSSMILHLRNSHNITGQNAVENPSSIQSTGPVPVPKRQKTLLEYCKKKTLEEEIARMVAESNHSFNQIATTVFIRESLASKYPSRIIPKGHQDVASLMMDFFASAEQETKDRIQKLKDEGKKFSATLDEWTSTANCRFLNVNLHYNESGDGKTAHINLGLVKIKGKCPAGVMVRLFTELLKSFRVDVSSDLVAVTGDGAPVMLSFGRLLGVPYLLCSNHTIHLAVTDTLFQTKNRCDEVDRVEADSDEEDTDTDDDESEEYSEDQQDFQEGLPVSEPVHIFQPTIKKMREIIKIFRYSPLKSAVLEKIQQSKGKKPLKLMNDVVTRWNSLVITSKRFLEMLPSTLQALKHKDIKSDIFWDDYNTEVLKMIIDVLEPARVATEGLSCSSINLLDGEGILIFLMTEIRSAQARSRTSLGANFLTALENRMEARRNAAINTLILYLSNHGSLKNDHPLQLSTKNAAVKLGIEMMDRLYKTSDEHEQTNQQIPFQEALPTLSTIHERLKLSVGSVKPGSQSIQEVTGSAGSAKYKKLFDQYDRHQVRDPQLNRFFEDLCSIQPTSTQSERNFSLASSIATTKRSRMSSDKLNAICFLKSYFQTQK